jgi:hypothetical protein
MRTYPVLLAFVALLLPPSPPVEAQTVGEVFRKVLPSVVIIRGKGRDISERGNVTVTETGAGVLVAADGTVMTAAHIVQAMDEITVEFRRGEPVSARIGARRRTTRGAPWRLPAPWPRSWRVGIRLGWSSGPEETSRCRTSCSTTPAGRSWTTGGRGPRRAGRPATSTGW